MKAPSKTGATESRFDQAFARVFEEITGRLVEHPGEDIESLLHAYPEQAERVRELLPVIQAMADVGHSQADASRSATTVGERRLTDGALGDFRLGREIGRGGMGIVYQAEQISLGRTVALKILPFAGMLDEKQLQRFKNEARAAATLEHPHIVPVYSVGCERGVHYFAMRFIDGQSLAEILHTNPAYQRGESEAGGARSEGRK